MKFMILQSAKYYIILILACGYFFQSCVTDGTDSCASTFDQLSLLENTGTNIIAPAYQALADDAASLNTLTISFVTNPDSANLSILRDQFQKTWLTWQSASPFEFGPAETENLRSFMNNFPVFVVRLEAAVDSGTYDLTSETYSYTRGFPALDYLLYGTDTSAASVVELYTTDINATKRKQYLQDVSALILQKANAVNDAWKVSGANYLNTFITTDGIASGKPMSDLVNQLNKGYENFKNNKLGTPISAKTSYIPLLPQNVEAYYSRRSLDLAIAAAEASKNVFMGNGSGSDSIGLDDFLQATGAKKGSADLHTEIISQFDLAISTLNSLKPSTLHDAINNDLPDVKAAYAAAQNQMVMIKTDMPSALCISITYIDLVDDGD